MEDNIGKKINKTNPITSKSLCFSNGTLYSTCQGTKDNTNRPCIVKSLPLWLIKVLTMIATFVDILDSQIDRKVNVANCSKFLSHTKADPWKSHISLIKTLYNCINQTYVFLS